MIFNIIFIMRANLQQKPLVDVTHDLTPLALKYKKRTYSNRPFKCIEVKLKAEQFYFRWFHCNCLTFERSPILNIKRNCFVIVDGYISWLSKFSTRIKVIFQNPEVS